MVTRAQIEQARADVSEARSQIETSRGEIQSSQEKVAEGRQQLVRKKRVPFTPRKERYARRKFREKLGTASSELSEAEKQLASQEQEIQTYERDVLNPADKELKEIEEYNAAVRTIERAAAKGKVWAHAMYGKGIVRKLAKKYMLMQEINRDAFKKEVEKFQQANPTEKLLVDWKNMKIDGVESGALQQSISLDNYNKRIAEINKSFTDQKTSSDFMSQLSSKTRVPTWEVQPAPTLKEKYRNIVDEKGYVVGSLDFLGKQLQSLQERSRQNQIRQGVSASTAYYQSEGFDNIANLAPKASYFVPYLGPSLLIAGGGESLATPSGRSRLLRQDKSLVESGWNPALAKAYTYGAPLAEIGLGAFGLKQEIGALRSRISSKLIKEATPQKIVGTRIEGSKGGIDLLTGYTKTKPTWFQQKVLRIKPTEVLTKIKQPYYLTSKGVVFEGGTGYAIGKQGKKVSATLFDVSGRAKQLSGKLKYGKGQVAIETDLQSALGNLVIKTRGQASGKLTNYYDPLTGKMMTQYKGKLTKLDTAKNVPFIGGAKEQDSIISLISGSAKKARLNLVTGDTSVRGSPEVFGRIKVIRKSQPVAFEAVGSSQSNLPSDLLGVVTKNVRQGSAAYAPEAVRQATRTAAIVKPRAPSPRIVNMLVPSVKPTPKMAPRQVQQQQSMTSMLVPQQATKQMQSVKVKSDVRSMTDMMVGQQSKSNQQQKLRQMQKMQQVQRTKQKVRQMQQQQQKQRMQQKQVVSMNSMLVPSFAGPARFPAGAPPFGFKKPKRARGKAPVKRKKKKRGYRTLPTLTQNLIGYKGRRAIKNPTGFEAIRIV